MPLPLQTERLIIRPFRDADIEDLGGWLLDPVVTRFLYLNFSNLEELKPRLEMYQRRQQELGYSFWAIERKEDNRVIGGCGLLPLGWVGPDVELAWHMRRDCWNKGYTTEAGKAVIAYGLGELGIPHIWGIISPENPASIAAAKKAGFEYVFTGTYKGDPHQFHQVPAGAPHVIPQGPDISVPEGYPSYD